MWNGARIIAPVSVPPGPVELAIYTARLTPENAGVTPTVRVVAQLPSFGPRVIEAGELPEETQERRMPQRP